MSVQVNFIKRKRRNREIYLLFIIGIAIFLGVLLSSTWLKVVIDNHTENIETEIQQKEEKENEVLLKQLMHQTFENVETSIEKVQSTKFLKHLLIQDITAALAEPLQLSELTYTKDQSLILHVNTDRVQEVTDWIPTLRKKTYIENIEIMESIHNTFNTTVINFEINEEIFMAEVSNEMELE